MTLQLATAAANILRDNHWVLNPVSGLFARSVLLEGNRTNFFNNTSTASSGGTVTPNAANAIDGTLTALRITKTSAADQFVVQSSLSGLLAAGSTYAVSRWVKWDGTDMTIRLEHNISTDWDKGWFATFNVTAGGVTAGAVSNCTSRVHQTVIDGYYRVEAFITVGAAPTTSNGSVLTRLVGASGISLLTCAPQFELGSSVSSFIATAGATVTRSSDLAYRDLPAGFTTPQAMTGYFRFIEMGTLSTLGARLFTLGTNATAALLVNNSGGFYQLFLNNGATSVAKVHTVAPQIGDLVELRVILFDDGINQWVQLGQSINGGAEVVTTASTTIPRCAAWSEARLYLNSTASGSNPGFVAFVGNANDPAIKLARGSNKSMAQMRAF